MELYERLTALRKTAGLSQEELAEILGISRQAVSKWETGASSPDSHNIVRLGELYGVSTDYILLGWELPQETQSAEQMPPAAGQKKRPGRGFIWFGLFLLAVLVLYYVTNGGS